MNVFEVIKEGTVEDPKKFYGSLILKHPAKGKRIRMEGVIYSRHSDNQVYFHHNDPEFQGNRSPRVVTGFKYTWMLLPSAIDFDDNSFELHYLDEFIESISEFQTQIDKLIKNYTHEKTQILSYK